MEEFWDEIKKKTVKNAWRTLLIKIKHSFEMFMMKRIFLFPFCGLI